MGVICAAFLCAVVNSIGGPGQGTRRLISGIFLALSLLHPLGSLELPELTLDSIRRDAASIIEDGTAQAADAKNEFITDALEAYILTKAEELGLAVEASVTLSPEGTPKAVELTGTASPSERDALLDELSRELGLGKEALTWKQVYQSSE